MQVSSILFPGQGTRLGIDDPTPLVAWKLTSPTADRQTAYELQVGTTVAGSDVLASGKVTSTAQQVELRAPLAPATRYFVRVRVWDAAGAVSEWADSWVETGLFSLADWQGAQWIGRPGPSAPQLRKALTVGKPVASARVYVAAGGYVDLAVNGATVSDPLEPGFTAYNRRVQYVTHDVTAQLVDGENVLAATLGRGFFGLTTTTDWKWSEAPWNGDPRLLLLLEVRFTDGTRQYVTSDATWRAAAGPTTADSVYLGDAYDSRLETPGWQAPGFGDGAWTPAAVLPAPAGALVAQSQPPIRKGTPIPGTLQAWGPQPTTVQRVNFGKVLAGWVRITFTANAGDIITLTYGEKTIADGTLVTANSHVVGKTQQDTIIAKGGTQTWEPRFSFKGFRWVYIGGVSVSSIEAIPVATELASRSSWTSSSPLLNQLHDMAVQSFRINAHGLQSDTPMYERNGWLGDANVMAASALFTLDVHAYFKKWLADMADALSPQSTLPVIVPHSGNFAGKGPEWTSAFVLIAWKLYVATGDLSILAQTFHKMKDYVDAFLVQTGNQWSSDYGDWGSPAGNSAPGTGYDMTATTFVLRQTRTFADIAELLGRTADAAAYRARATAIVTAINARLFTASAGQYRPDASWSGEFRQTNNVLALANDIVPAASRALVASVLEQDVRVTKGNHLNTGIVGSERLLAVLTEAGFVDTALAVALQTTYPSWGQWAALGATTTWNGYGAEGAQRSLSHHMHGTYLAWLYSHLAGITVTGPGAVTIRPYVPAGLAQVDATVETVRGPVTVSRNGAALTVTVAPGVVATYNGALLPSGTSTFTV